eukprot:TRINITY_DN805_c0_g1_i4.p1 TRINITY_DN805_c0_g1~~TRINITY_DN805_c0_g1_i4.p1  ORF type:complete len:346 (-),score=124.98 TRINITY_DN805_c0_g1_i4:337-1374(-)
MSRTISTSASSSPKRRRKPCVKWTKEEDRKLVHAVQILKIPKWKGIAAYVGTKNPNACFQHWSRVLDPSIRKAKFTEEELYRLADAVAKHGEHSWTSVAGDMSGRTDTQCRARWSDVMRMRGELHKRLVEYYRSVKCSVCHEEKDSSRGFVKKSSLVIPSSKGIHVVKIPEAERKKSGPLVPKIELPLQQEEHDEDEQVSMLEEVKAAEDMEEEEDIEEEEEMKKDLQSSMVDPYLAKAIDEAIVPLFSMSFPQYSFLSPQFGGASPPSSNARMMNVQDEFETPELEDATGFPKELEFGDHDVPSDLGVGFFDPVDDAGFFPTMKNVLSASELFGHGMPSSLFEY